ncbi:MAG: c-type cytochrome [Deltaproteobacteria bacterium]|nr:MAG: c-type cytochrome [Deltaproteobacteria bacterium]
MANQEHHDFDGITENREQRPPVYFTVLFYGLIVWGVAFCAFYLLSGWSSQAEFQLKMKAHESAGQTASAPPAAKPAEPAPARPAAPAVAPVAAATATVAQPDAGALFEAKCTGCHGPGGKGAFGPDLTAAADKFEYGKTRQALYMSIEEGRGNGKMPAFKGQLRREEIYAIADYILTLR